MLKLYVRCCSAMLLDLCPGVKCKDQSNILGPDCQVWPLPVKVSGSYSFASGGKVGGSRGQVGLSGGHVQPKLGYVMSC